MRPLVCLLTAIAAISLTSPATAQLRKENYGGPFGQTAIGNQQSVVISNVWNAGDAFPIAEKFCLEYKRHAKFIRMDGYVASFDCVKS